MTERHYAIRLVIDTAKEHSLSVSRSGSQSVNDAATDMLRVPTLALNKLPKLYPLDAFFAAFELKPYGPYSFEPCPLQVMTHAL